MTIQYSPKKKVFSTKFNTQRASNTLDINNDNGFVFKVKKSRKSSPTIPIIEPLNPKNISIDTEITLPLSDTPIAQRNIDIRASKGRRRSSLGLRGKRTTIGGEGLCSIPHASIEPSSYYKHIDCEQTDPVRMRQLLVWCGQKAMKPLCKESNHDEMDDLVAKVQLQILNDLKSKKINTSWYHRPSIAPEVKEYLPHPGNVSNSKQLLEYEASILRLQKEEEMWRDILHERTSNDTNAVVLNSITLQQNLNESEIAFLDDAVKLKDLDIWMSDKLEEFLLETHHLESVAYKTNIAESKTRKSLESLFSMMLRAYSEREKGNKDVDAMDMLKLLSQKS